MKAKAFILFGVFSILFDCFGGEVGAVDKAFGGSGYAAIIANPDSVKAWRTLGSLELEQYEKGKRANFKLADFYLKSGATILVSTNLAARLSKLLLDEHTYPHPGATSSMCIPAPGVVVTFSKGDKNVDVFFCFQCDILVVNKIQSDFDPAAILKIVKKIFPNDRQIQSLKDS